MSGPVRLVLGGVATTLNGTGVRTLFGLQVGKELVFEVLSQMLDPEHGSVLAFKHFATNFTLSTLPGQTIGLGSRSGRAS